MAERSLEQPVTADNRVGGGEEEPVDQQEPTGGHLAVQMPELVTIVMVNAYQKCPFFYTKALIASETMYVCTKGSHRARANEVLVLRCVNGIWTAYDSAVSPDRSYRYFRQPVFRCHATNVTQPGWHKWETNDFADHDAGPGGLGAHWQGELWAETRVP